MSSVASPFGLRPASHPSGTIRQSQGTITSGFATDIFQFSPVAISTAGVIIPRVGTVAAAGAIVGAFMGVEWTDVDGRRRVGNRWPANQVATDIVAYYTEDPAIVYEIQADAAIVQASIGDQFATNALTGNTTTGLSSVSLDVGTTATAQSLRVLGVNPAPDNIVGDAFTIVRVQISNHQFVAVSAAVA